VPDAAKKSKYATKRIRFSFGASSLYHPINSMLEFSFTSAVLVIVSSVGASDVTLEFRASPVRTAQPAESMIVDHCLRLYPEACDCSESSETFCGHLEQWRIFRRVDRRCDAYAFPN
jgi:hypothetical protein